MTIVRAPSSSSVRRRVPPRAIAVLLALALAVSGSANGDSEAEAAAAARARFRRAMEATTAELAPCGGRLGHCLPPLPPGETTIAAVPLTLIEPPRPLATEWAGERGRLVIECIVDEAGLVRDCLVLEPWPELEPAALRALAQWRFRPASVDGVPRASVYRWSWIVDRKAERDDWKPGWKLRWDRAAVGYEW